MKNNSCLRGCENSVRVYAQSRLPVKAACLPGLPCSPPAMLASASIVPNGKTEAVIFATKSCFQKLELVTVYISMPFLEAVQHYLSNICTPFNIIIFLRIGDKKIIRRHSHACSSSHGL